MNASPIPPRASRGRRYARLTALVAVACGATWAIGGCSTIGYYAHTMHGHFSMLAAAQPIDDVIADPNTAPALRDKLEQVQRIRVYASRELGLPDNPSYTRYADLKRPFVIWNVFATPALSLRLKESCFPITGCVGYRGYFDKTDADAYASELAAQGYDVQVGGVPAYSTLGWFDDPVLNTFIGQPEGEVARLIFHELAHQVVYVKGDTTFNESFATAVEQEGVERWLAARGDSAQAASYRSFAGRRADFLALLFTAKDRLAALYASDASDGIKRERKAAIFASLKQEYEVVKRERWNGFAGYDKWFARPLGNAHLAAVAAYTQFVPAFAALIERDGRDLPRFYADVKRLADLDAPERDARLAELCPRCVDADRKGTKSATVR